ncbi:flagellin [Alkalihalobacillus sp. BA299]|uniref:flagellin N-terminal helical domain-containing protein n=1 Tax=Alkalihalobacillus sp. BA299 TaxID=2815938 RepID=UPI001ADAA9E9|nr:flagellin [Alkalihalobacillus sp. BA299]
MKINNNIQALNAYRNLYQNQFNTSKNLEKLSSGLRINRAADDAAGLAISEKMRSQIRGLKQAERNALDGISLMQTSEGAMQEVHTMLQRMRELAVQAANDTNTTYDRDQIQKEIEQLKLEINSISEKTEFNTRKLLDGSSAVLTVIDRNQHFANLVGSPKVVNANLETGQYQINVSDVEIVKDVKQPSAGLGYDKNDITFALPELGQQLGEYRVEVRDYYRNDQEGIRNARISVFGPDGLPIQTDKSITVGPGADSVEVGGLLIDASKIDSAGTVKVSMEAKLNASAMKDGQEYAALRNHVTNNGKLTHGGIEYTFNSDISSKFTAVVSPTNTIEVEIASEGNPPGAVTPRSISVEQLLGKLGTEFKDAKVYTAYDPDNPDNNLVTEDTLFNDDQAWTIVANGREYGPVNVDQTASEADFIPATDFNVTNNALAFQIGPNTNQQVMIDIPRMDVVTLGIETIDVTTHEGANSAIFALDQAINKISEARSKLGATQNRMEHTINNLQVTHENLTAAESRIRDADMALEMTEFTKNNILNQSATAMLAQANQLPQGVLQLLQ